MTCCSIAEPIKDMTLSELCKDDPDESCDILAEMINPVR